MHLSRTQRQIPGAEIFRSSSKRVLLAANEAAKNPQALIEITKTLYKAVEDTLGDLDNFTRLDLGSEFPFVEDRPYRVSDEIHITFSKSKLLGELTENKDLLVPTLHFKEPRAYFQFLKSIGYNEIATGATSSIEIDRNKLQGLDLESEQNPNPNQGILVSTRIGDPVDNDQAIVYVKFAGFTPDNDFSGRTDSHEDVHALDPNVHLRKGADTIISELVARVGESSRDYIRNRCPLTKEDLADFNPLFYATKDGADINNPQLKSLLDLDPDKELSAREFNQAMKDFLVKLTKDTGLRNDELTRILMDCISLEDLQRVKEAIVDQKIFQERSKEPYTARSLYLRLKAYIKHRSEKAYNELHEQQAMHDGIRTCAKQMKLQQGYQRSELPFALMYLAHVLHLEPVIEGMGRVRSSIPKHMPTFAKIVNRVKTSRAELDENRIDLRKRIDHNLEGETLIGLEQKKTTEFKLQRQNLAEFMKTRRAVSANLKEFNDQRKSETFQKAFAGIGNLNLSDWIYSRLSSTTQEHLKKRLSLAEIEAIEKSAKYQRLWQSDRAKILSYIYKTIAD